MGSKLTVTRFVPVLPRIPLDFHITKANICLRRGNFDNLLRDITKFEMTLNNLINEITKQGRSFSSIKFYFKYFLCINLHNYYKFFFFNFIIFKRYAKLFFFNFVFFFVNFLRFFVRLLFFYYFFNYFFLNFFLIFYAFL